MIDKIFIKTYFSDSAIIEFLSQLKFSKSRTTLGVICHEVAHAIEYEKYQISKHGKRHFRIMKGVINYSKRRGYNKYTNSKEQSIQSLPKPFELNNPKSNL